MIYKFYVVDCEYVVIGFNEREIQEHEAPSGGNGQWSVKVVDDILLRASRWDKDHSPGGDHGRGGGAEIQRVHLGGVQKGSI